MLIEMDFPADLTNIEMQEISRLRKVGLIDILPGRGKYRFKVRKGGRHVEWLKTIARRGDGGQCSLRPRATAS